jgi:predicted TIM-barrel fold metal-dependent hydrolase
VDEYPLVYQEAAGLLPDPERRERHFTVISVDDHVLEPAWTFVGRLPAKFAGAAPRIVELDNGAEVWEVAGDRYPFATMLAVASRPKNEWTLNATRYSDMRPGCYQPAERIRDMDLDGVYASLNFPSTIGGFAGIRFLTASKDPELGLALVRAWNDWYHEEWLSEYPDRFIGCGVTWVGDPHLAADEVRRNAARGFTALSFPENPADAGLPPVVSGYWDPLLAACEETQTVLCLHVGSSQWFAAHPTSPMMAETTLFPLAAARATVEWLMSGAPVKFPDLQIALSEGGVGWVPMIHARLGYVMSHSGAALEGDWPWPDDPRDVLRRNFNFCSLEFESGADAWESIGIDHIMVEVDYPHADSSWPDTQASLLRVLSGLDAADVRKVTWENASRLYRHAVPADLRLPISPG